MELIKTEHPNYISSPFHSIGGWKVSLMIWNEEDGFYDIWNTSPGFKTSKEAENWGKSWAEAEGIEYKG